MDLTAILKLLKDNPEMLDKILPLAMELLKEVLNNGVNRLVDGILARV